MLIRRYNKVRQFIGKKKILFFPIGGGVTPYIKKISKRSRPVNEVSINISNQQFVSRILFYFKLFLFLRFVEGTDRYLHTFLQ